MIPLCMLQGIRWYYTAFPKNARDSFNLQRLLNQLLLIVQGQERGEELFDCIDSSSYLLFFELIWSFHCHFLPRLCVVAERGENPSFHVFDLRTFRRKKSIATTDILSKVSLLYS